MPASTGKPQICIIASSKITIKTFLLSHIKALNNAYEINIVVNANPESFPELIELGIKIIPVDIMRTIAPMKDMTVLIKLIAVFGKGKYQFIHSVTPKAGLLAMIAGAIVRVPVRTHIFTGQVWVTRKGIARWLLKMMDRLIAGLATHVLADSRSQRQFLVDENVVSPNKISVLANGSICGVNTARFRPDARARKEIREKLGLCETDVLFIFLGRLKRDKGVLDLGIAFNRTFHNIKNAHLLFVGPDEEHLQGEITSIAQLADNVHFIPYTDKPEYYMASADVLCLPSYREGFGNVIIEAAACGVPAIGSRIYGIIDAIKENETGFLYDAGDIDALGNLMKKFYSSPVIRKTMGDKAQERAKYFFSAEQVTAAWLEYYQSVL